jgi:hypothetical protein
MFGMDVFVFAPTHLIQPPSKEEKLKKERSHD